jgi:hypothetical protein
VSERRLNRHRRILPSFRQGFLAARPEQGASRGQDQEHSHQSRTYICQAFYPITVHIKIRLATLWPSSSTAPNGATSER